MSARIPTLVQDSGVPFDLFIQSLTEQLDKAQASMALKARVGKLPLTFAVKEVTLDLKAFVQLIDDDVFIRPAGPGDSEASSIKLGLTTITKPMIEENAIDFQTDEPKVSLRSVLGDNKDSEELQRRLQRIGVHNVSQLTELRKAAGTDVIARLARMPHNRLQKLLKSADAPRVTREPRLPEPDRVAQVPDPDFGPGPDLGRGPHLNREPLFGREPQLDREPQLGPDYKLDRIPLSGLPKLEKPTIMTHRRTPDRFRIKTPLINHLKIPRVFAEGKEVPIVELQEGELVLEPLATQLGSDATLELADGEQMLVQLIDGAVGGEITPEDDEQFSEPRDSLKQYSKKDLKKDRQGVQR